MTIQAKKHLGQNFLRNKHILEQIVHADTLSGRDILEIGPGPWDLTECLLSKNPKSLTVVEIDSDMIPLLEERFGDSIRIFHQDVLETHISNSVSESTSTIFFPKKYDVYGNIPYYITSPILMHFLYEIEYLPDSLTLTMQKEVAERILARDGKHSVLSLACQLVADVSKICDINPNNFVPVPKVWSTCLQFTILPTLDRKANKKILTLIKQGFSQKRKKLSSNLSNAGYTKESVSKSFADIWLSPDIRAEDLSIQNWRDIAHAT